MTQAADDSLVAGLVAGREAALRELYGRYGAMLHALAYRILGDREDAEEIVMSAFTQAWHGAGSYRADRGSVGAWLVTLARSRAIDLRRSRERHTRAVGRATVGHEPPAMGRPTPDTDARALAGERRAQVLAALSALPDAQRTCIELAYFDGLTQTEIAAQLAEPLGTVKTRMRTAMEKLRGLLRPTFEELSA